MGLAISGVTEGIRVSALGSQIKEQLACSLGKIGC
jgi:hypothetical protein